MECSSKIKQNNDLIRLIEKKKLLKNSNNNRCISIFIKFISFSLYSIFIIYVSFNIFSQKGSKKFKIKKKLSTIDKLKL